jgi:hypothetical protein
MPNAVDRRQRERQAKLREVMEAEGVELGPQLVGALEGLATEIFEQRQLTQVMIDALGRATGAIEQLTSELAEQRRRAHSVHTPLDRT